MASKAKTTQEKPAVQEATQESRAEALWRLRREAEEQESLANTSMPTLLDSIKAHKTALKQLNDELEARRAKSAEWQKAIEARHQMDVLEAQLIENFKPGHDKTITLPSGDKVQFGSKDTIDIIDGEAVAKTLIKDKKWADAKALVSVDADYMTMLIRTGGLPKGSAQIVQKVGLRMIGAK